LTFIGIQGRGEHYSKNVRTTIWGWTNHWSSSLSCLWQWSIASAWRKNKHKKKLKDARDVFSSYAFLNTSYPLRAPVQEVPSALFMTC